MVEFILHSLFTLSTCAVAFFGGVKLTERHHREKEAAVDYAHKAVEHYHATHYVSAIEKPKKPSMAAPAPMPPAAHSAGRFDKALAPGGPVDTRLAENGQATFLFPSAQNKLN